eukprot:TRINITY_DN14834_c0_g1_i2.p1 TRINITY_DN14834_c0_g1~~TRINITY_DN14834_c0_g1_i2.p1  ORF type:complete len:449 (-),score=43.79 TRINITY_DN14834_c0_g1_i2:124-1470(-)
MQRACSYSLPLSMAQESKMVAPSSSWPASRCRQRRRHSGNVLSRLLSDASRQSQERLLWLLALLQMPVSLYEEKRCVLTAMLLSRIAGGDAAGVALGMAHAYLLELIVTFGVARCWHRSRYLGLGRLLLVAGLMDVVGLAMIGSAAFGLGGQRPLVIYWSGQCIHTIGASVRSLTFPMLSTCLPENAMHQLTAQRRTLKHLGAILAGVLLVLLPLWVYFALVVGGMATTLAIGSQIVPSLSPSVNVQLHARGERPELSLAGCRRFSWLVAGRFCQSLGFGCTSAAVMLAFLRLQVLSAGPGNQASAERLTIVGSTLAHVIGLILNMFLGCRCIAYRPRTLCVAVGLYAALLLCYLSVGCPSEYLLVGALLSCARSSAKATSDALANRCARDLGPERAVAMQGRKMAFKAGLLVGKYSVVPLLMFQPAVCTRPVSRPDQLVDLLRDLQT